MVDANPTREQQLVASSVDKACEALVGNLNRLAVAIKQENQRIDSVRSSGSNALHVAVDAMAELLKAFPGYQVTYLGEEDPDWPESAEAMHARVKAVATRVTRVLGMLLVTQLVRDTDEAYCEAAKLVE